MNKLSMAASAGQLIGAYLVGTLGRFEVTITISKEFKVLVAI